MRRPDAGLADLSVIEWDHGLFTVVAERGGSVIGRVACAPVGRDDLDDGGWEPMCWDSFLSLERKTGRTLRAYYVYDASVAEAALGTGDGTELYVAAAGEAGHRGAALVAGECPGSSTSHEAHRVWSGRRFARAASVSGYAAYMPVRPRELPRCFGLRAGSPLFHGTPGSGFAFPRGPAWFARARAHARPFAKGAGGRVAAYRARRDLRLVLLDSPGAVAAFLKSSGLPAAATPRQLKAAACGAGLDGWVVRGRYGEPGDGDDVMLCSPSRVLRPSAPDAGRGGAP